MTKKYEVGLFLKQFKEKTNIWDIVYADSRLKNTLALENLELSVNSRNEVILSLACIDYNEGPKSANYGGDVWVFGKMVKGKEVYIKIQLGTKGTSTVCISFHIAERAMKYPFKNKLQ